MSRAPHLLLGARAGWKFGHQRAVDSLIHDGLWCAVEDVAMGSEADYIARFAGVTRAEQDAFAAESHRRAAARTDWPEIVAVSAPTGRGELTVSRDEGPRPDTSVESLAKLPAAFDADGTVTAGNASQLSDGAAAVVVVSEDVFRSGRWPLAARIVATATAGVPPKDVFIAPVGAVRRVLDKANLTLDQIDLVELNEAFAAQCLACMRPLGLDHSKTNVHGGAIALGHPIGASGARVLVTLLAALADRGLRRGLAALCLGGGEAVAMIVERC